MKRGMKKRRERIGGEVKEKECPLFRTDFKEFCFLFVYTLALASLKIVFPLLFQLKAHFSKPTKITAFHFFFFFFLNFISLSPSKKKTYRNFFLFDLANAYYGCPEKKRKYESEWRNEHEHNKLFVKCIRSISSGSQHAIKTCNLIRW